MNKCKICKKSFISQRNTKKTCSIQCNRINRNSLTKKYYLKHKKRLLDKQKTKKCLDCEKLIKSKNTRCRKCWYKFNQGKHHGRWKDLNISICIDCDKELSFSSKYTHSKRCIICAAKHKKYNNHHIDMNHLNDRDDNKLILTRSKHTKLHLRAYEYLVEIGTIRNYLKWFNKKYSLKG